MVFSQSVLTFSLAALALSGLATAHSHPEPGSPEFESHERFQKNARRSLANCQDQLRKRSGVYAQAKARRIAMAKRARIEKGLGEGSDADAPFWGKPPIDAPRPEQPHARRDGPTAGGPIPGPEPPHGQDPLPPSEQGNTPPPHPQVPHAKRDFEEVLNTSHKSNLTGITNTTDSSVLFDGQSSCVLAPETTEGPYYVDYEYVRRDVREDLNGVDIYVDVQLIDVNTCEPVPDVYIDFWHASAAGVYSGVVASGNGDGSESNINSTYLRGIQQTDSNGVAQWLSVFPGHYTGRATHIHIAAHHPDTGELYDNGTYASTTVSHVGQIFFDQDLITSVETLEPYASNTQDTTLNANDNIMEGQSDGIDPVLSYVLLGDSVEDGLMMWTSVGIDTSAQNAISAAATWTENGGVVNEGGMGGGPGGGGPGGPPGGSGGSAPPGAEETASADAEDTTSGSDVPSRGYARWSLDASAFVCSLWLWMS